MSIWSSLTEVKAHMSTDGVEPDVDIDVATAKSWNSFIRLVVEPDGGALSSSYDGMWAYLTLDQAKQLIAVLQNAVSHIEGSQ